MSLPEEEPKAESYLFGLASPSIREAGIGLSRCRGLYATNKRIFLVNPPLHIHIMSELQSGVILSFFAFILMVLTQKVTATSTILLMLGAVFYLLGFGLRPYKDFSPLSIQELEKRKTYEIEKNQISKIEINDRMWRIVITSKMGDKRTILPAEKGSFNHARRVFEIFSPELCHYEHRKGQIKLEMH